MIVACAPNHRLRNSPLLVEPEVGLLRQFRNAPLLEKLRSDAFGGGFIGDVLGALFAELEMRALAVRLGPGAAGTIDTFLLIQLEQRARAADDAHLTKSVFYRGDRGGNSAGNFADGFGQQRGGFFRRLRS